MPRTRRIPPEERPARGSFYENVHQGVEEALRALGHEPLLFDIAAAGPCAPEEARALCTLAASYRPEAVLDLCCFGYGLSQFAVNADTGRIPIYDFFRIPCIALLCDQPYFQAIDGIRARRLYAIYPDRGHREQLRIALPRLALSGERFVPPAARASNERTAGESAERAIDVLFVGNLWRGAQQRFWNDAPGAQLLDALANAALENPDRPLHLSFRAALAQQQSDPGVELASRLRSVELFLRNRFRSEAVAALARAGIRVRVIGNGWDSIGLPACAAIAPPTDYEGLLRAAAQAKICLDSSTYLEGVNDRVFNYLLNRAVCFTNAAGYLREIWEENAGLRFYSLRSLDRLVQDVRELLARPKRLREEGERAREIVLRSHTWRNRIPEILDTLRS